MFQSDQFTKFHEIMRWISSSLNMRRWLLGYSIEKIIDEKKNVEAKLQLTSVGIRTSFSTPVIL
jgi:hypothetical protein